MSTSEKSAGAKARAWTAQRTAVKLEKQETEEKKRKVTLKTEHATSTSTTTTSTSTNMQPRARKQHHSRFVTWGVKYEDNGLEGFQYDNCFVGCRCSVCRKRRKALYREIDVLKKERADLFKKLERNKTYTMLVNDKLDRYGDYGDTSSSDSDVEIIEDV